MAGKALPILGWGTVVAGLTAIGVTETEIEQLAYGAAVLLAVWGGLHGLTRSILNAKLRLEDPVVDGFLGALGKTAVLGQGYRLFLRNALDRIDHAFGDSRGASSTTPSKWWQRFPFSVGSYDFMLRLALVYPLLFMLVSLFTWGEMNGGDKIIKLSSQASIALFVIFAVLTPLLISLVCKVASATSWMRFAFRIIAVAIAVTVTVAAAVAIASAFTDADAVVLAVVVAFAVAVAGAIAFSGTVVFAFAFAFAFVFAFSFDIVVDVADAFAAAFAFALAFALALALGVLLDRKYCLLSAPGKVRFCIRQWLGLIALFAVVMTITIPGVVDAKHYLAVICVPFLILPLVNVPFDFVSLALTRGLLRLGLQGDLTLQSGYWQRLRITWRPLLMALLDFSIAFVMLLLLAWFLTLAMAGVNLMLVSAGSLSYIKDLPGFIRLLEDTKQHGNYWLYLTLFSTLTPTMLHFSIASIGAATGALSFFNYLASRIRRLLDRADGSELLEYQWMPWMISMAATVVLGFVMLLLYLLLFKLTPLFSGYVALLSGTSLDIACAINPSASCKDWIQ